LSKDGNLYRESELTAELEKKFSFGPTFLIQFLVPGPLRFVPGQSDEGHRWWTHTERFSIAEARQHLARYSSDGEQAGYTRIVEYAKDIFEVDQAAALSAEQRNPGLFAPRGLAPFEVVA
jgi:hypothetical protein